MIRPTFIVLLVSGGLDSVTLLHDFVYQGCAVHGLSVNYGQIHAKELRLAVEHCDALKVKRTQVELLRCHNLFQRCALTDGKSENPIVPNRNAILLSIAAALASSIQADCVAYACNKDDADVFPDCRWEFVEAMNAVMKASETNVEVIAPYIGLTKWQIVQRAKELKVPIERTWSCYTDKSEPCGKCLACKIRNEALK